MKEFARTLGAAQQGDEEAFARLWREYQPGLLRYLSIKSTTEAEDLAADIWLKVTRALPAFEGDEQGFRSWLFTTARNRVTDWYRWSDHRPEWIEESTLVSLPAADSVESEITERTQTDVAVAMIRTLPADQAEAVMLRVVADLEVIRVAEIMGRTPGSVRVLCHRGLKRLERRLNGPAMERGPGAHPPIVTRVSVRIHA